MFYKPNMSIKATILKANVSIALSCIFWLTGLSISKSAYSQILKSRIDRDMVILALGESERIQVSSSAKYYLFGELNSYITSHDYLAVGYINPHGAGKKISWSDLKNPITLLEVVFILLVSIIVLISVYLFKILLGFIFMLIFIDLLRIVCLNFMIFLYIKYLNN